MSFWSGIVAAEEKLEEVNYYELLGVSDDASPEEISDRYYDLAASFHPDRFAVHAADGDLTSLNRIYARLGEAKKVLLDPSLRAEYDKGLTIGVTRIQEVIVAPRLLCKGDPANPMAQSLYEKAMTSADKGEWKSAEASLKLALQFEQTSPALLEGLRSAQEKIAEGESQRADEEGFSKSDGGGFFESDEEDFSKSDGGGFFESDEDRLSGSEQEGEVCGYVASPSELVPDELDTPYSGDGFTIVYTKRDSAPKTTGTHHEGVDLAIKESTNNNENSSGVEVQASMEAATVRDLVPFGQNAVLSLQARDAPFSLGELVGEFLRIRSLSASEILGIEDDANEAEKKQAYEILVRLFHPHNNEAAGDEERMNVCRDLVGVVVQAYKEL